MRINALNGRVICGAGQDSSVSVCYRNIWLLKVI